MLESHVKPPSDHQIRQIYGPKRKTYFYSVLFLFLLLKQNESGEPSRMSTALLSVEGQRKRTWKLGASTSFVYVKQIKGLSA
jgi:hypothetical protein